MQQEPRRWQVHIPRLKYNVFEFRKLIKIIISANFLCWISKFKNSLFGFHQVSKRSKTIKPFGRDFGIFFTYTRPLLGLRPRGFKSFLAFGREHSNKIQTGPTGSPFEVDPFFRNFFSWTEPIHWVLDRNFRKFWLNGSRLNETRALAFDINSTWDI